MDSMVIAQKGRFSLLDRPAAYPRTDFITGKPLGPVFDLGVGELEDFYGVPYITAHHVEEMARILGMATKDEVDALRQRIADLEAQQNVLPEKTEELKNAIDVLVSNFHDDLGIVTGDIDSVVLPETPDGDSDPEQSDPSGDDNKSDGNSEPKSGSSKLKGTNELSGNSGGNASTLLGDLLS